MAPALVPVAQKTRVASGLNGLQLRLKGLNFGGECQATPIIKHHLVDRVHLSQIKDIAE
jgi:hypothetical protein